MKSLLLPLALLSAGRVLAAAPTFTSQPDDVLASVGEVVTFAAAVDGSEPIAYQWFHDATNAIPGASSNLLVLTSVQESDAGLYALVASNAEGCVTSDVARLSLAYGLTVASAHGAPEPAAGTHAYTSSSNVECRVSGVETAGTTRHVRTGGSGREAQRLTAPLQTPRSPSPTIPASRGRG